MATKMTIDENGQAHVEFISSTRTELEAEFLNTLEMVAFDIPLVVEYFYCEDTKIPYIETVKVRANLLTIMSVSSLLMDEIKHQIIVHELLEAQTKTEWFILPEGPYQVRYICSLAHEEADVLIRSVFAHSSEIFVTSELHEQLTKEIMKRHA